MLGITFTFYLKTLVCEVHEIIIVFEIIGCGTRSKISVLIDIDLKIISDQRPNSDVEFPIIVKKWLLNILLHYPKWILLILLEDKLWDVSHILENFDASTLIERGRLYQPHVAGTVLHRNSFIFRASSWDLSETVHEAIDFMVVSVTSNYKGGRCSIEDTVFCIIGCFVVFIIICQRFN